LDKKYQTHKTRKVTSGLITSQQILTTFFYLVGKKKKSPQFFWSTCFVCFVLFSLISSSIFDLFVCFIPCLLCASAWRLSIIMPDVVDQLYFPLEGTERPYNFALMPTQPQQTERKMGPWGIKRGN
jgi:hypothetical protein